MKRTRVFVTVPLAAKESVNDHVMKMCILLREDDRYAVNVETPCAQPSEVARSIGLLSFLERGDDHWLTIDSDNPPECNPLDLVEHLEDHPIIGLPTPVHQHNARGEPNITWNVYERRSMEYMPLLEGEGFQEVDAVGTGCMLISGSVFRRAGMLKQPFHRVWRNDGTVQLGSDLAFCERAKHCGFPIWVNWGYRCNHFSIVNLTEMMWLHRRAWDAGFAAGEKRGRECETSSKS